MFCCVQVLKGFSDNMVQAAANELKICKKQSRSMPLFTWSPSPHICVGGYTRRVNFTSLSVSNCPVRRSTGWMSREGSTFVPEQKK